MQAYWKSYSQWALHHPLPSRSSAVIGAAFPAELVSMDPVSQIQQAEMAEESDPSSRPDKAKGVSSRRCMNLPCLQWKGSSSGPSLPHSEWGPEKSRWDGARRQ